jgi:hypothetical protein
MNLLALKGEVSRKRCLFLTRFVLQGSYLTVEVCGANPSNTIFYLALPTRTALKGGGAQTPLRIEFVRKRIRYRQISA